MSKILKATEWAVEAIGWLRIMASPLFVSLAIAALIYLPAPGPQRGWIALAVLALGLISGCILATRISKKRGAMQFLSKVHETPDMNNLKRDGEEGI